jgi:hypothetical protein
MEVDLMHAVDADQQDVLDAVLVVGARERWN